MKAINLYVYKNSRLGGCSNGGISERYDEVLLLCDDGNIDVDTDDMPENLCKIVTCEIGGTEYKHIEPVARVNKGSVGWMSGGCFVGCSDGRFHRLSQYPLSLHDRQETHERYEAMNN